MLLRAPALPAFSERVGKGRMFSVFRSSRNKQINQKYFPLPQHLNNKKVLLVPEPILKPRPKLKAYEYDWKGKICKILSGNTKVLIALIDFYDSCFQ